VVVATQVNLLGAPGIEVDGLPVASPRGSKSWAVLAYLVLSDRPVPRARLVDLLFGEADDPGAALRWTLSQLRRALGDAIDLRGDPVRWTADPLTTIDTVVVLDGTWEQALALPGFGAALLEGVTVRAGAAFELWLSGERLRMATATSVMLHEAAHDRLAHGDASAAVDLATRLVSCEPLDEPAQELLVRALVAAGKRAEAAERVRRCENLFRSELGRLPSPALRDALRSTPVPAVGESRSAVLAAIDVGIGAAQAGAYDRAVEVLRRATTTAGDHRDELAARAMVALGTVLVHGVRGSDEEAIGLLHTAFVIARECGASAVAAQAAHELGLIETLRGHYPRMESWFDRARSLADGDPKLLAWSHMYAGLGRTDQAFYDDALEALEHARVLGRSVGDRRAVAYADTGVGRLHLLRGNLEAARTSLEEACAAARDLGWTSFLAFPQSLLAEVDVREGDLAAAEHGFEHSYALACQVGDPCWESYALRGRGVLAAAQGKDDIALDYLRQAPQASRRLPDTHAWVEGYCLDARCAFAVDHALPEADEWVEELHAFASRRGMRELAVRASLHRARLGHRGAADGALLLLESIDNPALWSWAEEVLGHAARRAQTR
jgi:DNA-binding SARP family transcriptional activator